MIVLLVLDEENSTFGFFINILQTMRKWKDFL